MSGELAIAAGAIALAIAVILLFRCFLITPLVIRARVEKNGSVLLAEGEIDWGIIGARIGWTGGEGRVGMILGGRPVWTRTLLPERLSLTGRRFPGAEDRRKWTGSGPDLLFVARRIWRHLSFRALSCRVKLGLRTAHHTGMVYGYFEAVRGLLYPVPEMNLEMTPDFEKKTCEGSIALELAVRHPVVLAATLLPPALRMYRRGR